MSGTDKRESWRNYYEATADRPPRRTLLAALFRFGEASLPRFAVDLGCGQGRDTVELLRRGWSVLAIDAEPQAIERLRTRPDLPEGGSLTLLHARNEEAGWPAADLVNASFSLPLCPPGRFPALWSKLVASLKPGGRFAGQLYGDRDGFAADPEVTCLDRTALGRLLHGLEVELFEEEESDGVTPKGAPKHWHIFHIVARRP